MSKFKIFVLIAAVAFLLTGMGFLTNTSYSLPPSPIFWHVTDGNLVPNNSWGINVTTAIVGSSTTLPSTCTVGQLFVDTDADTNGSLYICVASDTWKEVDDD